MCFRQMIFGSAGHFPEVMTTLRRKSSLFCSRAGASGLTRHLLIVCAAARFASGCIQPEYPDSFEEAFENVATDAAPALTAPDAGTGQLPIQMQNPLNPLVPIKPLTDAGGLRPFDAGVAAIDTTVPPDSGAGRDGGAGVDAASVEADAGGATPSSEGPTRCTITASTDASDALFYAGKYGCAVWISSASNKVLKAFFLATRIANRTGLTNYKSESAGVTVDVVAGATLNAPKQHQYTWMLTDTQGAKVPPGKYTLKVELHSSSGVELVSVPFDTSTSPVSARGSSGQIRAASIECE
jgi:hypothetical protein